MMGALLVAEVSSAQVLGTSARQLPPGSLKLLGYYQGIQDQVLNFSIRGAGACAALSPTNVGFACDQAGDVAAKGSGGSGVVKLVYQPWEGLQYYASLGVGDYSLRVPSTTISNTLTGDNAGLAVTFGAKAVIYPDTIVTPAIALDASVSRSRYAFNRRFPGGAPGLDNRINQRLDFWQYQFAVESSHLFLLEERYKIEPYGGVKWVRTQTDLHDLQDGGHAGGQRNTVTPFLGVHIPVFEREGLFAEASFIDGYQYAAGLEIRFK